MAKAQKGSSGRRTKAAHPVGGYDLADSPLELNAGRPTVSLEVHNTGDRPIQVGSHFHFFEANRMLEFDRDAAFGKRLDIPATTAVRFEPGDRKTVDLVPFGGKQRVYGFGGLVEGWAGTGERHTYVPNRELASSRAAALGYKSTSAGRDDA